VDPEAPLLRAVPVEVSGMAGKGSILFNCVGVQHLIKNWGTNGRETTAALRQSQDYASSLALSLLSELDFQGDRYMAHRPLLAARL
jgi:hypothetical protein